jgi:hypothetical protein
MADMNYLPHIKCCGDMGEVVGLWIEIVSLPGPALAAVTPTILNDATGSPASKKRHRVLDRASEPSGQRCPSP